MATKFWLNLLSGIGRGGVLPLDDSTFNAL